MRIINADQHAAAVQAKQGLRCVFSDRAYAMDRHGTLRRLPPEVPPAPVPVSISVSEVREPEGMV